MQQANKGFLPKAIAIVTLGLITAVVSYQAVAVDVYTEPVGFYKVTATNNSDTIMSVPFTRIPEFQGAIGSVSGNSITVSNAGWSANQFATPYSTGYYPYFAQLVSGAKEGAYFTVTNNTADTLRVITVPEDLSSVVAGDKVRIIPFWTLNTVFPSGSGVVASTSSLIAGRRSEVLFPNLATVGINPPAANTYYFFNNNWRRQGSAATSNLNDVVMLPDSYVIVRNATNAADVTTILAPGQVVMHKTRTPFYANSVGSGLRQDNVVSIYRPAVQTLDQSTITNAFVPSVSTLLAGRRDEVLVFDNTIQGKNKSAAATYFYFNNGWRRQGAAATINYGPTNVFNPGTGFIVRKATNTVSTTMWVNSANYTN